jgi:hypothetical protein
LTEDFGDGLDLLVVQLNCFGQFDELRDQLTGGRQQAPHIHKRTHNLNVHLDRRFGAENAGKHRNTLFGEGPWQFASSTVSQTRSHNL